MALELRAKIDNFTQIKKLHDKKRKFTRSIDSDYYKRY